MFTRHWLLTLFATTALFATPCVARATLSVTPSTSYDGSYTVSWTDASGGTTRAYLAESLNGGAWSKTRVTGSSRAYTAMPVGTYSYKLQIYIYDGELRKEIFEYETNVGTVLVTTLTAPGAPGAINGPTTNVTGAYALTWGTAAGTVDRYDLYQNGVVVYSGLGLSKSFLGQHNGTYRYKAQACNAAGCGAFTSELVLTITREDVLTELAPDHPAAPDPVVPDQQWVGTLPGTPSVDGGAATYRIPIEIPPGRAGVQPEVALTYSSRGGNGIAGVGWSLSATSSIYRCPRTVSQDGKAAPVRLTANDAFCLDGTRLVTVAGTNAALGSEYRTEVDPFDRITLRNGDAASWNSYFEIEEKSGFRSHYAPLIQSPIGGTPRLWHLVRRFDRQGNCVAYEYAALNSRGSGLDQEWVLRKLAYTGTMSGATCVVPADGRRVDFEYTSGREDARTTYMAGTASMMTMRLSAITTTVGPQAVRRYQLDYTVSAATRRSLLSAVRVCAGGTCGTEQLPATQFTYQDEAPTFTRTKVANANKDIRISVGGDYDGDGTRDRFRYDDATWTRKLELSWAREGCPPDNALALNDKSWSNGAFASPLNGDPTYLGTNARAADLDHDGRIDLIGAVHGVDSSGVAVGLMALASATCTGFTAPTASNLALKYYDPTAPSPFVRAEPIDYDGDGLTDVKEWSSDFRHAVVHRRTSNAALEFEPRESATLLPQAQTNEGALLERDFNGDGFVDTFFDNTAQFVSQAPAIAFYRGPGLGHVRFTLGQLGGPSLWGPNQKWRRWLDLNGDGLLDIYDAGGSQVWVNRGGPIGSSTMFQKAAITGTVVSVARPSTAFDEAARVFTMDVDADGADEVMRPAVRTLAYCSGDPYDAEAWWCGDEFDPLPIDNDVYDHSVFRWDAYKLWEQSDGTYKLVQVPTTLEAPIADELMEPTDYDGDGLPDVLYRLRNSYYGTQVIGRYLGLANEDAGPFLTKNNGEAPDLLIGVTNGLGARSAWRYQPLSRSTSDCDDGTFYVARHDTPRLPGNVFFTSSMWAVSSYEESHGTAAVPDTNKTCFHYEDAMLNVEGRGFQGFKKIVAEERLPPAVGEDGALTGDCGTGGCSVNNLRTTTEFHQEFPFTNKAARETAGVVMQGGGELPLSETIFRWHAELVGSAERSGPWVVYASASDEKKFDYRPGQTTSGGLLVQETSITEVDLVSGVPRKTCTSLDDVATRTKHSGWPALPATVSAEDLQTVTFSQETATVTNDTIAWWLGRVDSRQKIQDFSSKIVLEQLAPVKSTPAAPVQPIRCPTFTPSARAAVARINYEWHLDSAATGSRRRLKSEAVVPGLSGTVEESRTTYPAVGGYDQFGNITRQDVTARDVVGPLTTTVAYSVDGYFPRATTNPVGHVSTAIADPATGLPTAKQPVQNGPWTRTTYDPFGRILTVTTDGSKPVNERLAPCPSCGLAVLARSTYQAGAPTTVEYLDHLGRPVMATTEGFGTNAVNVVLDVEYNRRGAKIAEYAFRDASSPTRYVTRYSGIDALGRVGRKEVERDPLLFPTAKGDRWLVTDYDHAALGTAITVHKAQAQGGSLEMSRTYDARGKLIETTQSVDLRAIRTRYLYDPAGRLTHIVDAAGNDLRATYDALGRKTAVLDPDRGNWTYAWDGLGKLRYQTDARGVLVAQSYDGAGRPTLRTLTGTNGTSTADTIWLYDQNGQYGVLSFVEKVGDFRRDFRYDALLRPWKVTTQIASDDDAVAANSIRSFTVEYGYDNAFGRLKAVRLPSATAGQLGETFAIDYDGRGHQVGETQLVNYARAKQYRRVKAMTPRGQVAQQTFGNCVAETTGYDASAGLATFLTALRPTLQTALPADLSTCSTATGLVRQLDYAHDHFLNLEQQAKNYPGGQATEKYTYDELQRLKSSTRTWPATPGYIETDSYGYDDLGNIISKSDYGTSYAYGNSARTTRWAGPHAVASVAKKDGSTATFEYDKNGNMIGGDGRTIDFDLLDRPVRVVQGATVTTFAYAPDGGRYRQRVWNAGDGFGPRTVYYVDKDYELVVWNKTATRTTPLLEERSYVGSAVTVYRQLPNAREVRYLHLDRLGSTEAVTPDTPAATPGETHSYDPFGKPRAADLRPSGERLHPAGDLGVTSDHGFTGHEHLDAHYLIHMNGRVYDYRLGRFLSVDPIISNPLNSQSINPYSYIGNNPLSGVDPTGYTPKDPPSSPCTALTGSHICNTGPAGSNLQINGLPVDAGSFGSLTGASNGSVGQRTTAAPTGASNTNSPGGTAQQDSSGMADRSSQRTADDAPPAPGGGGDAPRSSWDRLRDWFRERSAKMANERNAQELERQRERVRRAADEGRLLVDENGTLYEIPPFFGGPTAIGQLLGDLTQAEVKQIQTIVDKAGRPLDVVGSAARGMRRGVGTDQPMGKGPGTRSDIDYVTHPSHHPYFRGLQQELPSIDPRTGIVPGSPNPYMGPSIRFEPNAPPRFVPQVKE